MYSVHSKKIAINSIRSRKEFTLVYSGSKAVSDTVVLFSSYLEKDSRSFAFVASKKVGSAVSRNRAKRRMRGALRAILSSCSTPNYADENHNTNYLSISNSVILVARNTILSAKFEKIVKDMKYCMKKSGKLSHSNT